MPIEVIMPKVDMDMTTGTIVKWYRQEGERVTKGDPLFDMETDKAAMEVEAPGSGVLHHIVARVGDAVDIGGLVAWLYEDGEEVAPSPPSGGQTAGEPVPETLPPSPGKSEAAPTDPQPAALQGQTPAGRPRATPAARAAAREHRVPIATLSGTGPRGRIQAQDVLAETDRKPPALPQRVPNDTGPLHVIHSGPSIGVPLVLIHGFAADATSFAPIEPALAARRPVIRIDLPGHGKSPRRVPRDFPALASELRATFDDLDCGPVHLAGHSLGGALALALADTRPRLVRKLTLLSPAGLGPEANGAAIRGLAKASRAESLGPWVRQLTADPDAISENFILAAAMFRADPRMRAAQVAMAERVFPDDVQSFDLVPALHRLTCPTCIVFGKEDRIIPYRHALRAPGRVALHLYDRVGHLPQFEIAEEITGLLMTDL